MVEQESVGRLATSRLIDAQADLFVDLLFASSGIEVEIVEAADRLEIVDGLYAPVARIGHLIALKLLARDDRHRPADADDLRHLAAEAVDGDWIDAESAARLIEQRGFARGRDLNGALAKLRTSWAY